MLALLPVFALLFSMAASGKSAITQAQGSACLSDGNTRQQVERIALTDAKRLAAEYAISHIKVTTTVENFALQQDLIESFVEAEVKVLSILHRSWDEKQACYFVKISAEILPLPRASAAASTQAMSNPMQPLTVRLWTSLPEYKVGQNMRIYLQGNKPFYGRLLYKDASGNLLQVLPNPSRSDSYFNGAVIYQLPDSEDAFELEVSPPLGEESLTLYASTAPLGHVQMSDAGAVYAITEQAEQVPILTRGLQFSQVQRDVQGSGEDKHQVAEFDEVTLSIRTVSAQ